MSDTAIGMLLICGWSVAVTALVRLWICERKVERFNGLLDRATDELVDARAKLANVRKNSIAARDYGLGSQLECSIWSAATKPHGPNVIPLVKMKEGEKR